MEYTGERHPIGHREVSSRNQGKNELHQFADAPEPSYRLFKTLPARHGVLKIEVGLRACAPPRVLYLRGLRKVCDTQLALEWVRDPPNTAEHLRTIPINRRRLGF